MKNIQDEPAIKRTVSVDQPGARSSPTMWGIFFEDINFGADGGLYPELVKNRSFEFPDNMMGWLRILETGSAGYMYIEKYPGNPVNAHYLRMDIEKIGDGFGDFPGTLAVGASDHVDRDQMRSSFAVSRDHPGQLDTDLVKSLLEGDQVVAGRRRPPRFAVCQQ